MNYGNLLPRSSDFIRRMIEEGVGGREKKRFNMILVNSNNLPPQDIIFEGSDVKRDTGLILLKQKSNDNRFEIHLHNDFTN